MIRKSYWIGNNEKCEAIWKVPQTGKLVYKIQGHDANALYLYW